MTKHPLVLIVDDEEICRTIAETMVKHIGLSVITAGDGLEAVEQYSLHNDEIACVIMDIQMPRMNGIEAFHQLKKMCKDVKVIIISGHLGDANKKLLEPLQPAGILNKPFNFEEFADLLGEVVGTGEAGSGIKSAARSSGR
jgi:CheY-like chemotaxis protein